MEKMLITSGYDFEGYRITEYLDFCSGECALGTGFLSSLGAGFADLLGRKSDMYSDKLNEAKNIALEGLKKNAVLCGANAIIGVDVDFTTFSSDIMGVVASGTAVKIEPVSEMANFPEIVLSVNNFNPSLPIRPTELKLYISHSGIYASVLLFDVSENNVDHVDADLTFGTLFGDDIECSHVYFTGFSKNNKRRISKPVAIDLPANEVDVLKNVTIRIKRYIDNEAVVIAEDKNLFITEVNEADGSSNLYGNSLEEFIDRIQTFTKFEDIYNFAMEFNKSHDNILSPEFIEFLDKKSKFERMYGSRGTNAVKDVENYLKSN